MHQKLQTIYDNAKAISQETLEEFETVFARCIVEQCLHITNTKLNAVMNPDLYTDFPPEYTLDWLTKEYVGVL
jgi:hypothetical protein